MGDVLDTYKRHALSQFLNERYTKVAKEATMGGMGKELPGRWLITDSDYPKFLDLLHDYLFVKNGRSLNLVEQPRINEPKPLLIDLDFRYPATCALSRTFTLDHIRTFCTDVLGGLKHFFGIDQHELIRFFVTLRPAPYHEQGKPERKDGVHIICPDVTLTNDKQKVLREWLMQKKSVANCFAETQYTNADEDVYDKSMTHKQGWFFFGESKPNIPRYELAAVYYYNEENQTLNEEKVSQYDNRQLMEILSIRYHVSEDINPVREDVKAEYQKILNPPISFQKAPVTSTSAETEETEKALLEGIRDILMPKGHTEEEKGGIRDLVIKCLSTKRADAYDEWMRVGWCLHNIEPSEEMFTLWMDFSRKSSKFKESDIPPLRRDWFSKMRKTGDGFRLTELSLKKWAREDNPEAYNEIMNGNIHEFILRKMDATHFHVARLMKEMYGGNYVASINSKTTEWWFYDDELNMWKEVKQGIKLRRNISFEVADRVMEASKKYKNILDDKGTPMKDIYEDTTIKKLRKINESLYNSGFTDSVMKMAANFFYIEDFHSKLNANVFLFGCKNGVLDLRSKEAEVIPPAITREHVIFRQGRPEDYVSFLAGQNLPDTEAIDYIPLSQLTEEQEEHLAGLKDFFAKLFPEEDLRRYVLRLLASCLEGCNREQCYYTFIGGGSNGKSKLNDLCRMTLGDYWCSLQTTALTRKRPDAGAANPEIMAVKNRRFIGMQEPDDKEPINTSRMKQFSGEDIIEARGLFQDQEKFKITGKLIMMTNKLPPIHTMDHGTWRRIRVVPFKSKFATPDDPDLLAGKPFVYPRDPEMDAKLREWREVFLSWLVDIYDKEYITNGLEPVPMSVKQESMTYKESFDSFAKFRGERIRKEAGEKTTMNQISRAYTRWLDDGGRRGAKLSPKELQTRLNDEFGDPADGKTYNHIIVFLDEMSVEEWDKEHAST